MKKIYCRFETENGQKLTWPETWAHGLVEAGILFIKAAGLIIVFESLMGGFIKITAENICPFIK